jgi:predicted RNA binding protein YcfA (HicA-like mRNA interferase family)
LGSISFAGRRNLASLNLIVMPDERGCGDVKVRDAIRLTEQDEWYHVRTKGSHRQYQRSAKPRTVTVAGKLGVDVPIGTLNSILKQAGFKRP